MSLLRILPLGNVPILHFAPLHCTAHRNGSAVDKWRKEYLPDGGRDASLSWARLISSG